MIMAKFLALIKKGMTTIGEKKQMRSHDPWKAKNVKLGFTEPFLNDGYTLTTEMVEKYKSSPRSRPPWGRILPSHSRLFKNVTIFDVTGFRVTWADISPADAEKMCGVYYLLSEHKVDRDKLKIAGREHQQGVQGDTQTGAQGDTLSPQETDPSPPISPFEKFLSEWESIYAYIDIEYMKMNAIARIVDGEIQTSRDRFRRNYQ